MRKSIGHCLLVAVAAMALSTVGTGCKTGGWSMPGASWVSWGKKKPPTSSIAGTREPTKPPSISVPPYPPGDSSSTSSAAALASYPSNTRNGAAASSATGLPNTSPPTASPSDIAVGPYSTSSASRSAPPADQGFYYPESNKAGAPQMATADARNGYAPGYQPGYESNNSGQPNSTFSPPTGYGNTTTPSAYGAASTPYSPPTGYAAGQTPPVDYAAPAPGTTDNSYPTTPVNPAPSGYTATGSYPTTPYPGNYPTTEEPGGPYTTPPTSTYGQAPVGETANSGVANPANYGPAGYGQAGYGQADNGTPAPVYSASSQNSAYGAPSGTTYGSGSTYDANSGYRPGSTGRNANLLGPSGNTRMASPTGGTTYPSNYYNR